MGYPRPRDYYKSGLHQEAVDKMSKEEKKREKERLKKYNLSINKKGKIIALKK